MTHKDLAAKLGVSPATLSLIINNKPGISDETRKKVIDGLESLGYSSLMKEQTSETITLDNICFAIYKKNGAILDQHPFFLLIMESLEYQAQRNGYNLQICTIDARNPVLPQISRLNEMNVKGVIFFATEMDYEDLAHLRHLKKPYIFLDNDFSVENVNSVSINNTMGTFQAISHLVDCGFRRIGYLRCINRISSFDERDKGYREALGHFGLKFLDEDILPARYSEEASYRDFKQLLSRPRELPRAFVTDDDTMVSGFVRVLSENGLMVPKDISIVGFNDRPSCELFSPPLTSIDIPKHSFGAEAVDALVQLIRRHEDAVGPNNRYGRALKTRVCTQIVIRNSTRKLKLGESPTVSIEL